MSHLNGQKKYIKYYQKNFSYPILGHCGGTPVGPFNGKKEKDRTRKWGDSELYFPLVHSLSLISFAF